MRYKFQTNQSTLSQKKTPVEAEEDYTFASMNITIEHGKSVAEIPEFLEFLLHRMTNDEFQSALDQTLHNLWVEHEAIIKSDYAQDTEENFTDWIKNMDPEQLFSTLADFGIDCWLEPSLYPKFETKDYNNIVTFKSLLKLMDYLQIVVTNESKLVLNYEASNIRLHENARILKLNKDSADFKSCPPIGYTNAEGYEVKYKQLNHHKLIELRVLWAKVINFNRLLATGLALINTSTVPEVRGSLEVLSIGTYVSKLRDLSLMPTKTELSWTVLQKTAVPRDPMPKIVVERLAIKSQSLGITGINPSTQKDAEGKVPTKNLTLKNANQFIFLKAYEQFRDINTTDLRPTKPKGTEPFICFDVEFKGENVQGVGGPYRAFFSDISSELQPNIFMPNNSRNLNLFIASPNAVNGTGDDKDKFIVNPSANSSFH